MQIINLSFLAQSNFINFDQRVIVIKTERFIVGKNKQFSWGSTRGITNFSNSKLNALNFKIKSISSCFVINKFMRKSFLHHAKNILIFFYKRTFRFALSELHFSSIISIKLIL